MQTLRGYQRCHPELQLGFHPETFLLGKMDAPGICESNCLVVGQEEDVALLEQRLESSESDQQLFILKPYAANRGRGITVETAADVKALICNPPESMVVQHYISNPLLLDCHKFDIRMYACVLTTVPLTVVYWPNGFLRVAMNKYSNDQISDQMAHLTNVDIMSQVIPSNFVCAELVLLTHAGYALLTCAHVCLIT